jgi:hypothetical protein
MSKSSDTRYAETVAFIKTKRIVGTDTALAKLGQWRQNAAPWEQKRVLDAMHFGKGLFSTKASRLERRAIILLRAAVLRHDLSKVSAEVQGLGNHIAVLTGKLQQVINQSGQAAPESPHMRARLAKAVSAAHTQRDIRIKGVKENRKAAHQAQQQAEQAQSALTRIMYVPADDPQDDAIQLAVKNLFELTRKMPGQVGLDVLDGGGELYVIGHGNFGEGIGTHHRYYGARKLMALLHKDGLSKDPSEPVWIYLWACWGATHVRRGFGMLGKRVPMARRMARAMATNGFSNHYVVGFGGSVFGASGLATDLDYGGTPEVHKQMQVQERYVVYEVKANDYNRVAGQDWTTKASPKNRNTTHISVTERGGSHNR